MLLAQSKAQNSGWIVITWGWGMAVMLAVFAVGQFGGAHLNPASHARVRGDRHTDWSDVPAYGRVRRSDDRRLPRVGGLQQPLGGDYEDPGLKLAVFRRSRDPQHGRQHHHRDHRDVRPGVRHPGDLRRRGDRGDGPRGLLVGLLVLAIGLSLGGPTGYAINPAATSDRGSCTRSCRSRARARRTGATPGSRWSVRSSAASSARGIRRLLSGLSKEETNLWPSTRRRSTRAPRARCMIFDHGGKVVAVAQKEHEQIYPKPGWVEHDPMEIWQRCQEVMQEALESAGASAGDIAGLGITSQRETTVVWDRNTGEPVMNAIVWQDTRTDKLVDEFSRDGGQDRFREQVGLPLATYFSGPKVRWILDNVEGAASARRPVICCSATSTRGASGT